jgi:hypothetical protein
LRAEAIAAGMTPAKLQELIRLIERELPRPWQSSKGRPRALPLARAVVITCMQLRSNSTQMFLGATTGTSQSTISRILTRLTPLIARALEEHVPTLEQAQQAAAGRVLLVDGTLAPCWSYKDQCDLWNGKHNTTGFNIQVIGDLLGNPVYIADPLPGNTADPTAYTLAQLDTIVTCSNGCLADKAYFYLDDLITPRKRAWGGGTLSPRDLKCNAEHSAYRAAIERVMAHLKNWRVLHTDYRRPYATYGDTFNATRALFFHTRTT